MSNTLVRIKLKSFDHRILDNAAGKIVETIKRAKGEEITILRAVHKYKDSRQQYEMRTHKRLIDIKNPSKEVMDVIKRLDIPSGVDIQIKQK